ncbi:hypothetical protein Nepgr_020557 [Nepenthes gracilis]|uniref:Remorin C-terminal domain-containing protein n=1 Tax=Nepenthes gracilis TaxID=150966 RepID=A0AAD3SXH7_NEPGR|nr:hypothetical protein Nepgr_020557 [Nepenthes gracilis]
MLSARSTTTTTDNHQHEEQHNEDQFRDIHALTQTHPPPASHRTRGWEAGSHRPSSVSMASDASSSENFTTMSREFNALLLAGSTISGGNSNSSENDGENNGNLRRIGEEEEVPDETNPLAIVPGSNPLPSPTHASGSGSAMVGHGEVSVQRVKREEVEAKISAWQNAKIAKINNRFKREDAVISGWENEKIQNATSWMKKVERKLEEKRARAMEKMQNDVAKAHRKAEERRATAEGKRGTRVARVLEIANLMRAVGRAPTKRSFF